MVELRQRLEKLEKSNKAGEAAKVDDGATKTRQGNNTDQLQLQLQRQGLIIQVALVHPACLHRRDAGRGEH